MSVLLAQIEEQALSLSAEQRAMLAETMLESLHSANPEIEAAWEGEIASRLAALDRGEMRSFSAEEVFAETPFSLQT
jgi:putative addiction module component (TIGR02574 family)